MIIRRRQSRDFTILENAVLRDRRISLDEMGLLAWLRSQPDDWEVSRAAIARTFEIGRDKARRIINNLIRFGWLLREDVRREDGTFDHARYLVRDEAGPEVALDEDGDEADAADAVEPSAENTNHTPVSSLPQSGYPSTVHPSTDKPSPVPLLRTENYQELSSPLSPQIAEPLQTSKREPSGGDPPTFHDCVRLWPPPQVLSAFSAERVFVRLPSADKLLAWQGIKPYLDDCRNNDRKVCDLATYLRERRWQRLVGKTAAKPAVFMLRRGSPESARWREYFALTEPQKLKFFDHYHQAQGNNYAVPSQWPPAKPPNADSATGPPARQSA